jgi:hypothetical protein
MSNRALGGQDSFLSNNFDMLHASTFQMATPDFTSSLRQSTSLPNDPTDLFSNWPFLFGQSDVFDTLGTTPLSDPARHTPTLRHTHSEKPSDP